MKIYHIDEKTLNKILEMLDDYSTLVYYDFEIKDLIKELKELKKMKLIKTKLLLKYNHNSAVGFATASHLDFCKYQVRHFKDEPEWTFKWCIQNFAMSICSLSASLLMPFVILSNGIIFYPCWIVLHIVKTKRIVKRFGVKYLNKSAEKLVKELKNENI